MARGQKTAYTGKQRRKAEHIEQGYRERGLSEPEAEARAWATVNKQDGGGKRSGAGRGRSAAKTRSARKDSARRAVSARKGHPTHHGSMTGHP